jgi:hypothetical protein
VRRCADSDKRAPHCNTNGRLKVRMGPATAIDRVRRAPTLQCAENLKIRSGEGSFSKQRFDGPVGRVTDRQRAILPKIFHKLKKRKSFFRSDAHWALNAERGPSKSSARLGALTRKHYSRLVSASGCCELRPWSSRLQVLRSGGRIIWPSPPRQRVRPTGRLNLKTVPSASGCQDEHAVLFEAKRRRRDRN